MPVPPSRRPMRALRPLQDFLAAETAGALLLLVAALVALVWANSPWKAAYASLWSTETSVHLGRHVVALDLRHVVNDGLMTLFFLVVGLEIKRELVEGELAERRRAVLPVAAALGGMAVPALLYFALNAGGDGSHGWGIPMATDIAIAMGVLRLVAPRGRSSLTLLLLTLAIVDDIGAIVVIAVFHGKGFDGRAAALAVLALAVVGAMQRFGVQRLWPYMVVGTAMWLAVHESGVHATLVGVVLGLLAPARPRLTEDLIEIDKLADVSTVTAAQETVEIARQSVSVVEWLEARLHPWTSSVIIPVFAFANAGVSVDTGALRDAAGSRVAWGIVVGLVLGKPIGITLASWLAVRSGLAVKPEDLTWRDVVAVASLGGIGFTVSIFIAGLAFTEPAMEAEAKVAILAATLLASCVGWVLLRGRASTDSVEP